MFLFVIDLFKTKDEENKLVARNQLTTNEHHWIDVSVRERKNSGKYLCSSKSLKEKRHYGQCSKQKIDSNVLSNDWSKRNRGGTESIHTLNPVEIAKVRTG